MTSEACWPHSVANALGETLVAAWYGCERGGPKLDVLRLLIAAELAWGSMMRRFVVLR